MTTYEAQVYITGFGYRRITVEAQNSFEAKAKLEAQVRHGQGHQRSPGLILITGRRRHTIGVWVALTDFTSTLPTVRPSVGKLKLAKCPPVSPPPLPPHPTPIPSSPFQS